jgi:hypothetical protein
MKFLPVILIAIFCSCNKQATNTTNVEKYGKSFNTIRKKQNAPLILDEWVVNWSNSSNIYWSYPGRGIPTSEPIRLAKVIFLKDDKAFQEEDIYHYDLNDTVTYRLKVVFKYEPELTLRKLSNEFVRFDVSQFPANKNKFISEEQADSILTAWHLGPRH